MRFRYNLNWHYNTPFYAQIVGEFENPEKMRVKILMYIGVTSR
jgi:hypothetical protein